MAKRGAGSTVNYSKVWKRDNYLCRYCSFPGDCIDHIIPWALLKSNQLDNLVVACTSCNGVAGSLVFSSFEEKRDYVLSIRRPRILSELG